MCSRAEAQTGWLGCFAGRADGMGVGAAAACHKAAEEIMTQPASKYHTKGRSLSIISAGSIHHVM